MEEIIAGLLNDFEKGKMTRRQLIRSLALAAAAAAPAGTALAAAGQASMIPPPKDPAPWKTVWLDHISFQCTDYRRSTAFYRDLMGWEIVKDDGQRQCTMKIGNFGGIIIRNHYAGRGANATQTQTAASSAAGSGAGSGGGQGRGQGAPVNAVIDHISFGVQPWDTDKVKAELERRGLNPRPDMVGDKFKSFHVKDPDGWDLQISNQTDTSQL